MCDFQFKFHILGITDDSVVQGIDIQLPVSERALMVVEVVGPVLLDARTDPLPFGFFSQVSVAMPCEVGSGHIMCGDVVCLDLFEQFQGILNARVGGGGVVGILASVAEQQSLSVFEDHLFIIQVFQFAGYGMLAHELAVVDVVQGEDGRLPDALPGVGYWQSLFVVGLDGFQVG